MDRSLKVLKFQEILIVIAEVKKMKEKIFLNIQQEDARILKQKKKKKTQATRGTEKGDIYIYILGIATTEFPPKIGALLWPAKFEKIWHNLQKII
jgi:hypothetical protein